MQVIKNMKKTIPFFNAGFTLLEAIVAIAILLVAIVGPMNIAQKSLHTSLISRDEMTATFLAEDIIEAARTIRDQYKMNYPIDDGTHTSQWADWTQPFTNCICTGSSCDLDTPTSARYCNIDTTVDDMIGTIYAIRSHDVNQLQSINNINPLEESRDPISGLFIKFDLAGTGATSFVKSKFSRYFNIIKSDNEVLMQTRVTWNSPDGLQQVNIKHMFNNY